MNDNLNTIVEGRVFEGKLFATHRDRGLYIGTLIRNRPQWLKENAGSWRCIKDIEREAASLAASVGTEVSVVAAASGPNSQTSSHDIRKDGAAKSDVISVDIPADDTSPSCQPESVSLDDVPSGSMQPELPPVQTGRSVGRQRKKRTLSAKVLKARRQRMLAVVEYLREIPILSIAARKAGIHRKTLEYWIKRSEAGDDGYDFEEDGLMWRFHQLVEFALDDANDQLHLQMWDIAMGGVVYKKDERLLALGLKGPDAYLRDENGIPLVEKVRKPKGGMLRRLLARLRPEEYGEGAKIEVPHRTGVILVDGADRKPDRKCPAASIRARKWKALSRELRQTKD